MVSLSTEKSMSIAGLTSAMRCVAAGTRASMPRGLITKRAQLSATSAWDAASTNFTVPQAC
ncbi:MAG: hypothetical protein A3J29_12815 [Acidobacteria bacterium RIFCSPLOWO2_12_FULL_67_14b]|nr:MAG: hypothetical protein A3J29_12815 [Acidobacteria bacterium RIFCSPLOWO2_12_FULL_67_14b]